MGTERPYVERFPPGTRVLIRDRAALERFRAEWRDHNPLLAEQLEYAGRSAAVLEVGFYHGGDPLYVLEGTPGVWHEPCLTSFDAPAV